MSLVAFRRIADEPPPLRELLSIEADGAFRLWRSNAEAVGRFAGTVPDLDGLARLVETATEAAKPEGGPWPADASLDTVVVGGVEVRLRASDTSGPWGALAERLRALLETLTDQPVAAIALVLPEAGAVDRVRLEHRGTAPLVVNLGALAVTLEVFRDTATVGGGAGRGPDGTKRVEVGPGWSLEVEVTPTEVHPGTTLLAQARFVADDGGVLVPMTVEAVRQG